jgi:hypothetical protein
MLVAAIALQVLLLAYHQVTTQVDLFPFNGARFYKGWEKVLECGVNGILMSLAPVGFAFGIRGLMWFGVFYYFVLFAEELRVWWVPYFFRPTQSWQAAYDRLHSQFGTYHSACINVGHSFSDAVRVLFSSIGAARRN